jgi:hypothetical protein
MHIVLMVACVVGPTIKQASFKRLMLKQQGMRTTWEYPFAVAGVNISYMLIQLLELNSGIIYIYIYCGRAWHLIRIHMYRLDYVHCIIRFVLVKGLIKVVIRVRTYI